MLRKLILGIGVFVSGVSYADCWEYQVVDTDSADRLVVTAASKEAAQQGIVAVLNKLGSQGWEIVSEHQVQFFREDSDSPSSPTIARLNPSSVLLKRDAVCNRS